MPGNLTLDSLRDLVAKGEIDTVLSCIVDMQGRLMGKRFHAQHFLDGGHEETHGCNYLLAVDVDMATVPGYKFANWAAGYGDHIHKPDLATLRLVPWLPGTALVLGDTQDHATHADVPHAPRSILKRQVERARAMGFEPMMATELEFYLFENSYENLRDGGLNALRTVGGYNEDYHVFQTTKEEDVMRAVRNGLYGAGIPVENSKGEAEAAMAQAKTALEGQDADALKSANDRLTQAAMRIGEAMYKAQGEGAAGADTQPGAGGPQGGSPGGGGGEKVVDADFEEVDPKRKAS